MHIRYTAICYSSLLVVVGPGPEIVELEKLLMQFDSRLSVAERCMAPPSIENVPHKHSHKTSSQDAPPPPNLSTQLEEPIVSENIEATSCFHHTIDLSAILERMESLEGQLVDMRNTLHTNDQDRRGARIVEPMLLANQLARLELSTNTAMPGEFRSSSLDHVWKDWRTVSSVIPDDDDDGKDDNDDASSSSTETFGESDIKAPVAVLRAEGSDMRERLEENSDVSEPVVSESVYRTVLYF